MSTTLFADVERPVRDWLRGQALTGIGARVYVGLPSDATLPAIEVTLIDAGVRPGEAPVMHAFFSFSVWGGGPEDRQTVADAAAALASLLQSTNSASMSDLRFMGAEFFLGPTPRFDQDGTPRYQIDAALTLVKVV